MAPWMAGEHRTVWLVMTGTLPETGPKGGLPSTAARWKRRRTGRARTGATTVDRAHCPAIA